MSSGHVALVVMALAVVFDRCRLAYPPRFEWGSCWSAQVVVEVDTGWVSHWLVFTWWGRLRRGRHPWRLVDVTLGVMRAKDEYWMAVWMRGLKERGLL